MKMQTYWRLRCYGTRKPSYQMHHVILSTPTALYAGWTSRVYWILCVVRSTPVRLMEIDDELDHFIREHKARVAEDKASLEQQDRPYMEMRVGCVCVCVCVRAQKYPLWHATHHLATHNILYLSRCSLYFVPPVLGVLMLVCLYCMTCQDEGIPLSHLSVSEGFTEQHPQSPWVCH